MTSIARLAIFSAIGFSIGGLLRFPVMLIAFGLGSRGAILAPFTVAGFGFAAQGALGGAAIGLALRKGWRFTGRLALLSAVGFLVGGLLFGFVVLEWLSRVVPPNLEIVTEIWPLAVFVFAITVFGLVANEAFRETEQVPALRKRRRAIATLALLGTGGVLAGGFVLAFLRPAWTYPLLSTGAICLQ